MFRILRVFGVVVLASGCLPAQPEKDAFVSQFTKALDFGDERGMDRAVRNAPRWVTFYYEELYRQWLKDQSKLERRKTLRALNASFKRVFDDAETLDKISAYWDDLDLERMAILDKTVNDWWQLVKLWDAASKEKKPRQMRKLLDRAMEMARKFEELGHALKASEAWATVQTYFDALPDRSLEDRRDGFSAIERFVANRKRWGWTKDLFYHRWVNWLKGEKIMLAEAEKNEKARKEAGFKEEATGPEKFIVPGAKEEVGKLEFKALRKMPRSCFIRSGPVPALWMWVVAGPAEGDPVHVHRFTRSDIFLVRTGATKFGITRDGTTKDLDKNPWQEIEARNRIKHPSVFYLDKAKKHPYAMWFYTAGEQEAVVGLVTNLAPQRDKAQVFYRSGASWETTLNGVKVTFLDDNADGKLFSEDPFAYDWKERTLGFGDEEKPVPCYDSMIIGKGEPVPYSSWVKLGEKWFHLREAGGAEPAPGVRPLHADFFKTGTLEMKWVGRKAKPELLVVRGKGPFLSASFDIAGGKPVEVPVGEYTISYGRVVQGKGARTITADILPGDSETIVVKEGESTVVELGAPFKIDFEWTRDKGFIVVDSTRFKVKGRSGEHYARINGAVPAPEVLYAKNPDSRRARPVGEFIPITNADMLNKAGETLKASGSKLQSVDVGFFAVAKGDPDFPTKVKFLPRFPDGHVGLRQRRHKLFGKLEPNFK